MKGLCRSLTLFASIAVSGPVIGQTIWPVVAGQVQATIQAASPGDVLVFGAGVFEPFQLDKGLTIRGNGAFIGDTSFGMTTINVPAGQIAHIVALDFSAGFFPSGFGGVGAPVRVTGGTVRFEACNFRMTEVGNGSDMLYLANASTVMTDCTLFAAEGVNALVAVAGSLEMQRCTVQGADDVNTGGYWPARHAAQLTNTSLHAENCSFYGGDGNSSPFGMAGGGDAIRTTGPVWLVDCELQGGPAYWPGMDLANNGTTTAELRRCLLVSGNSTGSVNQQAPLVAFDIAPPWSRGTTSTLDVIGDAGAPFAIWVAPETAPVQIVPAVEPLWMTSGPAVFVGLLDASGNGAASVAVPNVASLEHQVFLFQAVSGMQLPMRASSVDGGVIR